MKVIKTYEIRRSRIICRIFPAVENEDFFFSPNHDPFVTISYGMDRQSSNRLLVNTDPSMDDAFVLDQVQQFITTLKTMYQL